MEAFLANTDIVDWHTRPVRALAVELAGESQEETIRRCFHWVRDEVTHSFDVETPHVTCSASDVLSRRTGICYAKSHLLAALLRANGIPAAFGYQRLSIDEFGGGFCLHGFNYVRLETIGWHPCDPRGDNDGISTTFEPPQVSLAFETKLPGEQTYDAVLADPLPGVVEALKKSPSLSALRDQLPDCRL